MTVLEVIQRSTEFLAKRGVDSPRLQVELLLAHVLGMPRLKLYLNFDRTLRPAELEAMRFCVKRRGQREPLQHIVGTTSFCGVELRVTPDVLVPRPETEELAEQAWKLLESHGTSEAAPTVLDFGTGSGCLAIVLALKCPAVNLYALDISSSALQIARQNATRHGVLDRIQFVEGDGLGALPFGPRFDLMVANPPYIPTPVIPMLDPEVRDFDPRVALDGGKDGLDFYRRLSVEAPPFCQSGGQLMVELGDEQAPAASQLFAESGWTVERILPDLAGKPRILIARRPGS